MHEAALASPLLRLILEETAKYEQARGEALAVTRVTVRAGLLMGVEAPTLAGIFALMAENTPAERAELIMETEAMNGTCPDCGATVKTASRHFNCPLCGGENVEWTGGNELYIASINVTSAEISPEKNIA